MEVFFWGPGNPVLGCFVLMERTPTLFEVSVPAITQYPNLEPPPPFTHRRPAASCRFLRPGQLSLAKKRFGTPERQLPFCLPSKGQHWGSAMFGHTHACGCGSKNRYLNGTLVSGHIDQNLRNPSCLILSHTHVKQMTIRS